MKGMKKIENGRNEERMENSGNKEDNGIERKERRISERMENSGWSKRKERERKPRK